MNSFFKTFVEKDLKLEWVDAGLLFAITCFLLSIFPIDLLTATLPATGSDIASHYWPLHSLVNHGIFTGSPRVWNPGNLAGEPHLIHYFPLPFLIMAALSLFLPLHIAFNVGTMLSIPLLPLGVYFCLRALRLNFPAPIIGAAFSVIFLFTDSYTVWGGNIGSTLAGQFCHQYAVFFLLIGIGFFSSEIRKLQLPYFSTLSFAAVALSHGYILLLLPIVGILLVLFLPFGRLVDRFKNLLLSGFGAFLLSAWWLIPSIDNNKWTTAYADKWIENVKVTAHTPLNLLPLVFIFLLLIPLHKWAHGELSFTDKKEMKIVAIFLAILVVSIGFVFIFPKIGLVDIRTLPQAHLSIAILAAIVLSSFICLLVSSINLRIIISVILVVVSLNFAGRFGKFYEGWARWLYSSWNNTRLYDDLVVLSDKLRGNFSDPRIVFEHDAELHNDAGTPRVFENLPYFANRATLESVYMQASPISGVIFAAQAMASLKPSCPFPNYRCPAYGLKERVDQFRLLGVNQFILVSDEVRASADETPELELDFSVGPWWVYRFIEEVSLVGFFKEPPRLAPKADWQQNAYRWFLDYRDGAQFEVVGDYMSEELRHSLNSELDAGGSVWIAPGHCKASVDVDFNAINLKTNCPGVAHILKFSFNHAFVASTGDKPFLVYPGFIGIVPSESEVELRFGNIPLWNVSLWISCCALLGWFFLLGREKVKSRSIVE